jgi:hypothetical protein
MQNITITTNANATTIRINHTSSPSPARAKRVSLVDCCDEWQAANPGRKPTWKEMLAIGEDQGFGIRNLAKP